MKKPICKILRTNKNNNFKFIIKFLMTLDMSYIGYLGFLVIDFLKSVLMYSKGAICLSRLLFKMGLFTVCRDRNKNGRKVQPWDQANTRQKLGLVWRNRKKISQNINAYLYLPFYLLIILCTFCLAYPCLCVYNCTLYNVQATVVQCW